MTRTLTRTFESADEVAARWGVHRQTVIRMMERGEIPAHRVGRLIKFDPDEVDAATRIPARVDDPNVPTPAEPRPAPAPAPAPARQRRSLADYNTQAPTSPPSSPRRRGGGR